MSEMFVSPRVIDQRAYSEMVGELRELVRKSAGERSTLGAAIDQAIQAVQEFRERETAQQGNIELTARALRTLDERAVRVEAMLSQAMDQSKTLERLDTRAEALIDAKVRLLESRLEAVGSAATAKAEALEERVRRASRELEQRIETIRRQADTIAGPAQAELARLCDRAGALAGREPGAEGTHARGSLGDLIARGEALAAEAQSVAQALDDTGARVAIERSAVEELGAMERRIGRDLESVRSELSRQGELAAAMQRAIEESRHVVGQTLEESAKARSEGATAQGELRSLVQQTRDSHGMAMLAIKVLSRTIDQAKTLAGQLEPWRGLLDGKQVGEISEAMRGVIERVRGELGGGTPGASGAARACVEQAERVERGLYESVEPVGGSNPLVAARVAALPMMPEPGPTVVRQPRAKDAAD